VTAAVLTVSDRVSRGEAEDRSGDALAELLRADGYEVVRRVVPDERAEIAKTPHGLLSRGVAGVVGGTLVVNLPGSTGGCRDGYAVLRPALGHAVLLLRDEPTAHQQTAR
jgi:molybdopterin biosynthesis enzyme MoaB